MNTYTWFEHLSELCRQLDSESVIDSILTTAVDESMITFEQAQAIAYEVHLMSTQFSFQTEF